MPEIANTGFLSDASLQGYWRLETDGTDSGPNGYTVVPGSSPAFVPAVYGNGGSYTRASSHYLTIAEASCPNLAISGNQTWTCWAKPTSFPADMGVFAKYDGADGFFRSMHIRSAANGQVARFRLTGLSGTQEVFSSTALGAGTWYFLAGVYNATGSQLKMFVNNVKESEQTAFGTPSSVSGDFSIGRVGALGAGYYDGIVDDVAIFDRALSDSEVVSIYQSQMPYRNLIGVGI